MPEVAAQPTTEPLSDGVCRSVPSPDDKKHLAPHALSRTIAAGFHNMMKGVVFK